MNKRVMTRGRSRFAGMLCLAVIGLTAPAEAGNGPSGGGGFGGGPPGGGFSGGPAGGNFGSRKPGFAPPNRSDGYDYSGRNFDVNVRRTRRGPPKEEQPQAPPNANDSDFWQRFRNGFGVFGGG